VQPTRQNRPSRQRDIDLFLEERLIAIGGEDSLESVFDSLVQGILHLVQTLSEGRPLRLWNG
jgi:hypothetical protein